MSNVAVTFPGKFGDCFWSLATIKEISKKFGQPVDFYTMSNFSGLIPIVDKQSYIAKSFVLEGWNQSDDNPGAQPWQNPPLPRGYEYEFALGYKAWPNKALIDSILDQTNDQYNLDLSFNNPIPFLENKNGGRYLDICFGFSNYYDSQKEAFLKQLLDRLPPYVKWMDASLPVSWDVAFNRIASASIFVGDKSSLHVLAHGLGKKVVETESNKDRRTFTFSNPHAEYWRTDVENILDGLGYYTETITRLLNETNSA